MSDQYRLCPHVVEQISASGEREGAQAVEMQEVGAFNQTLAIAYTRICHVDGIDGPETQSEE